MPHFFHALVVGSLATSWVLQNQVGLTTSNNLQQTLSLQVNLTSGPVAVQNGSQAVNFTKTVAGDTKPVAGPPWATWLDPISHTDGQITFAWPSSSMMIPAGKSYHYWIVYDQESGSQTWEQQVSEIVNERSRFWKTFVEDEEIIQ